jgi:hypothetical protein
LRIENFRIFRLYDCPAEIAKKSANDDCKDFVYNVIKKLGELYMNSFLLGYEEGIKEVKAMQQKSTNGVGYAGRQMQKENDQDGQVDYNRRVQIDADQESQEDDSQGSQRVINSYRRGDRRGYNQRSYGNNQRYQDE